VKRRHEHDVIATLDLVLVFALQLPVCFIDENQYSRSPWAVVNMLSSSRSMNIHRIVKDEEFLTRILHDFVAKMPYEKCHVCRLSRFVSGG
jgi:hypothetical protein